MKPGRAGTMTHDYKRNSTTTLFAALNVLTGVVIGQCLPRHRNGEFLKFLRRIDKEVPKVCKSTSSSITTPRTATRTSPPG